MRFTEKELVEDYIVEKLQDGRANFNSPLWTESK